MAQLNFHHHYSSLQCHMTLQKRAGGKEQLIHSSKHLILSYTEEEESLSDIRWVKYMAKCI